MKPLSSHALSTFPSPHKLYKHQSAFCLHGLVYLDYFTHVESYNVQLLSLNMPPRFTHRVASIGAYSITKSCLTLYDPMDCSLPDSSVRGLFQARIREWVAISSSRECS